MASLEIMKLTSCPTLRFTAHVKVPAAGAARQRLASRQCVNATNHRSLGQETSSSLFVGSRASPSLRRTYTRVFRVYSSFSDNAPPNVALGGGNNGGDSPNKGYGGDESGDNGKGEYPDVVLPAGKSIDTLPADMQAAFVAGKVPQEIINRYFDMNGNLFLRFLMSFSGLRERLLADPSFLVKLAIECGIGIVTKCSAEYTKRGDNFFKEADFVFANVIMAIIADYMLTYLPAPTLSFAPKTAMKQNAFQKFLASCPENAFQKVPVGYEPFSVPQRVGAVVRNGTKLLGVGFGASMLGVGITNALILVRQVAEPGWAPPNAPQNPAVMSAAYATYMASSSNLRYQIVAGVLEERGIEVLFKGNPALCHALSFIIRTSNTFLGSLMWVDYIRLLGLQPKH